MEVTSIRNQLMLLLDNLKNIQPSERDNLIKYMKTTLSQLQENDGKDKNNNANDTDHDCSSTVDGTPRSRRSMPSPTYQMKTESSDLSDFMDTNLNYLQLSADMVPEAEAVEEVNDFSELTTSVNHDTSIDSHDFPEVIDVHEFLSITDAAALNCSDPTGELNLNEAFQEDPHLLDNTSSNTSHQSPPPSSSSSGEHQLVTHHETYLNCPLCRVNFDNWPNLENHLFTNHNTYSVAPVCWRCQGVFKNHAVLLAHECFDWGRLYLPCRVFMNNNNNKNNNNEKNKWGKFHKFSKEELERKQFPMDGVFLSRRCGLCYKSGVTYTSYEEFEKHKSLSHSVHGVDSGFEPPSLSSRLQSSTSSVTRKKRTPLKPKVSSNIHPCSDAAVRSVVRNLTERFYMLKNQKDREKQRANRRRKSNLRNRLMKKANTSAGGVVLSKRNRHTDVLHPSEASLTIPITMTCNNDSADASEDTNTTVRTNNPDSTTTVTTTSDTNLVDTDTVETIISPTMNNLEEGEKSPNYCPSTFLTSLLAAQRAKRNLTLKNKRSCQQREVSSACSPNNDANAKASTFSCEIPSCSPSLSTSPSPSIGSSNTSEYNIENMNIRRNYWLLRQNGGRKTTSTANNNSNNTSRRLRLQFKRKSYADFQKKMPTTSFTDNYRVNPMKIKRFICQCCSAVFRLSSRLRVHYLFQHGHIPESLGGLSPRPNETVINCEWNQSSQENINDKSERTSATSNNNIDNNATDNKSESNQLLTQDNMNRGTTTTTTLEAAVTGHTTLASSQSSSSSNVLNESKGNSIYLNTRNRKRKAVNENSIIDSTDSTDCTTTTVRSCRPTKKSVKDITNQNGRKSRSTDVFSQDLTTDNNEIDQMISDENLPLKRHYCPECDLTFAKSFNLKRHESIIHRREYRYFCGYCEFRTGQQLAYEEHLARHFNVKQFVCEICNSRFTSKRELDDHVSFKHSTERNFVCSECDQRFKTSGTLWRHKKTHEKRVYHICSICSASFTRLSNLNRHYRRTHKRQQKVSNSQTNETEISVASKNSRRSSKNRRTKVSSTTSAVNEKPSRRKNSTNTRTCIINDNKSRNTVMPIDEDDSTSVLNTVVHEDISYEQTIAEVIPVEITPQIPSDNCSSSHQTLADIFQDPHHDHDHDHASLSELIDMTEADLSDNVVLIDHQSVAVSCSAAASSTSSTLSVATTSATVLTSSSSSTTECSLLSASNITAYQTVNIPDNTAVYMLNFTDLNNAAGGHAFYESTCTNLIHENSGDASHHHTMMISVPDSVYHHHHQAAGFVDGPSAPPSSSSASVGTIGSLPSSSSSSATVSGGTISIHPNFLLPIQLTTTSPYSSKSSTLLNSSNDNNNNNCNTADDNGGGVIGGHDVTVSSDNSHQQQQLPWSTVISCHPEPSLCYLITATEPLDSDISFDVDEEATTATSTITTTTGNNNIYTNSNTTSDSNPTSTLTVTTTNHSSNEEGDDEGVISNVNTPSSDIIVHKQSFASVDILNSIQPDVHSINNLHETDYKSPEIVFNENCLFYESYPSTTTIATTTTTTMESSLSRSSSAVSSSSTALHFSTATTIWRPIDDSIGLDSVVEQHHEQQQQQQRSCHHTYQFPVVPHCSTVASTVTITSTTTSAADETLIPFSNANCRHQMHQLFPVVISESLSRNDEFITQSIGGNSGSVIAAGDDSDRLVEHIIASNQQHTSVNPTDLLEDTNMMISWNPTSTITTTTTINNNNNNNSNNSSNINTEFYHYQHCSPKFPSPDPNHLSSSPILSGNQYHHHHEYDLKNFSSQAPAATTSSSASSNHQCISNPITSLIEASGSCSSSSSDSNSNDSTNFFEQFYEHPSNTPSMNVISHQLTSGDNYNLLNNNNSICSISNLMNEANTCYDATTHSQLPDDYQVITDNSTDEQCSNFSVGYLIGHSSMPPPPPPSSSSSVTSSSSPSSSLVASSSTAVAPAAAAVLSPTDGLGTVINYFDNSFNHPLHCLSSNQHQQPHQQQQRGDARSLCQLNFKSDSIDYDFL
ncbi:unnamed protein product [Trichobilharzia szidati]|nr:unnamed protein product [Trichobilharzia szidati]